MQTMNYVYWKPRLLNDFRVTAK